MHQQSNSYKSTTNFINPIWKKWTIASKTVSCSKSKLLQRAVMSKDIIERFRVMEIQILNHTLETEKKHKSEPSFEKKFNLKNKYYNNALVNIICYLKNKEVYLDSPMANDTEAVPIGLASYIYGMKLGSKPSISRMRLYANIELLCLSPSTSVI